jgi:hypothetical protein
MAVQLVILLSLCLNVLFDVVVGLRILSRSTQLKLGLLERIGTCPGVRVILLSDPDVKIYLLVLSAFLLVLAVVAVVASLAVVALGLFSRDSAFLSLATTSSYTSVVLVSRLAIVDSYSGPSAVSSASILISLLGSASFFRLAISLWIRVRVDAAPSIVSMGPILNLMNSASKLRTLALSSLWCILLRIVHTSWASCMPITWPSWLSDRVPLRMLVATALFWCYILSWSGFVGFLTVPVVYPPSPLPSSNPTTRSFHTL